MEDDLLEVVPAAKILSRSDGVSLDVGTFRPPVGLEL